MSGIREVGWWRWPLWSWRNLAVTVMGAAVLVAGLGRVSGGSEGVAPEARALEVAGTASGAPSPSPPASAASASPAPSVTPAALESPEDVAVAFVGMWARPDAEVEEWRASCKALSTPRFAAILDAASSAAVPRPAWSGTPRSLSAAMPAHESVSRRTAERCTSHWNERRPGGGSMASSPRNSPWRWRRGADPWTL